MMEQENNRESKVLISLVSTVYNEMSRLDDWIKGIESQTVQPDEVIITDAGSTDGTLEALEEWQQRSSLPIQILVKQGCNVAEGRNLSIENSTFDIIVSTDFGCRFHIDWLKSLITHFSNDDMEVVGGNFTVNIKDLSSDWSIADYINNDGFEIPLDHTFSVTSRSIAYKKYVWEEVGGYPEWLTLASDDSIFWRKILAGKYFYEIAVEPYVFWNRHTALSQYYREGYRYGLGDGESGLNRRNLLSHLVESLCRVNLYSQLIALPVIGAYFFWFLPFHIFGLRSHLRTIKYWVRLKSAFIRVRHLFLAFVLTENIRYGYIKGYFFGLFFSDGDKKNQAERLAKELGELHNAIPKR